MPDYDMEIEPNAILAAQLAAVLLTALPDGDWKFLRHRKDALHAAYELMTESQTMLEERRSDPD